RCLCFFFSSRRRHTRSKRDWSSDVCSSDLIQGSGSFLTNMSLTYLDDFIQSRNLKSKVIATVHDSILIDCPPEEAKIMAKVTLHIMENLPRSEEHTSELQSRFDLVCRLLLEKK